MVSGDYIEGFPSSNPGSGNRLADKIKRKQREIEGKLKDLGDDGLEEKLKSALPVSQPYGIARMIVENASIGRMPLIFELSRHDVGAESSNQFSEVAKVLIDAGADGLAVCTDSDDTPEGLIDVVSIKNVIAESGRNVPLLQKDWFLHPLQIAESQSLNVSGILGIVTSVSGRGTVVMSSFAAALGIDAPVEIVNMNELRSLEGTGSPPPFFGLNISVSLSVSIPGFGSDVAKGLLGELPYESLSLVGCKTIEEARKLRLAGADALLIKSELVAGYESSTLAELVKALRAVTNSDD